jgi:hypothetical protein
MFSHVFTAATLTKGVVAISLVAGAYGAGNVDRPTQRPSTENSRVAAYSESEHSAAKEAALMATLKLEREKAEATKPIDEPKKNEETKKPEGSKPEEKKPAKTEEVKKSEPKPVKTEPKKTEPKTEPKKTDPSTSFDALLKECAALYVKSAEGAKAACEKAIKASGLSADAFWTKYSYKLVVPTPKPVKTEPEKTVKSPKPVSTPKPTSTDALVQKCKSMYEAVKTMKTGPAQAYEVAMRAFNDKCRQVLEAAGK